MITSNEGEQVQAIASSKKYIYDTYKMLANITFWVVMLLVARPMKRVIS